MLLHYLSLLTFFLQCYSLLLLYFGQINDDNDDDDDDNRAAWVHKNHDLIFLDFLRIHNQYLNVLFSDREDNLLRVADASFVGACQAHTVSRYYNCDIATANDTETVNNRTWLTCPTYIGKTCDFTNSPMSIILNSNSLMFTYIFSHHKW